MPKSEKNSVAAWNWWQFQPVSCRTPIFGNHCAEEVVVADRAGARERARHARGPGDLDVDGLARRDRRGERHLGHRPIIHVPIVGRDEAHAST